MRVSIRICKIFVRQPSLKVADYAQLACDQVYISERLHGLWLTELGMTTDLNVFSLVLDDFEEDHQDLFGNNDHLLMYYLEY